MAEQNVTPAGLGGGDPVADTSAGLAVVKHPESARAFIVWGLRIILWWLWFPIALVAYPFAVLGHALVVVVRGEEYRARFGRWLQWMEAWLTIALANLVGLDLGYRPVLWEPVEGGFGWGDVH